MPKPCSTSTNLALSEAQQVLARDVLEQLSSKWTFWILHVLGEAGQPMRFARVHEAVTGISQKVLTRTLRSLEYDGFIKRTIFAEVPPRVEYELTALGTELLDILAPLLEWVVIKVNAFEAARARFDGHDGDMLVSQPT
jgi:DNA-binding HxlR family transcriptional regulator